MNIAPQTPHRQMRMDSPMSDYFTDPSNSPDLLTNRPTSSQQELLRRLQSLGDWVLRQELSSYTAAKAHIVLDELQDVLVAPDPQSRQPADIDESDLFSPEDEIEADDSIFDVTHTKEMSNTSLFQAGQQDHVANQYIGTSCRNKKLLEESQEVLMRVSAATQKLQMRYQEVKGSNAIAQEVIEQSSREIMRLRSGDERLRSDNSFNHSEMLHLKSRLDTLEANATSLISKENFHTHHQDLRSGIECWKVDWNNAHETSHHRELQRIGAMQKNNRLCDMFDGNDFRLSTKSDFESSIGYNITGKGNCPARSLVENKVVEDVQLQGTEARADNIPARDDNDNGHTGIGYLNDDYLTSNENSGGQQSRMITVAEPTSLLSQGSQSCNSGQKAKSGNWAKLWDQLAELAGIYDY